MFPTTIIATITESAVQEHELGTLAWYKHPTYKWQLYRYIYNDEASTAFAAGDVVTHDISGSTTDPWDGIKNTDLSPAGKCLGIAQGTITAGYYGWVCIAGKCLAQAADTGVDQAGAALVAGASGDADPAGLDLMADGEEDQVIAYGLQAASGTAGTAFLVTAKVPV